MVRTDGSHGAPPGRGEFRGRSGSQWSDPMRRRRRRRQLWFLLSSSVVVVVLVPWSATACDLNRSRRSRPTTLTDSDRPCDQRTIDHDHIPHTHHHHHHLALFSSPCTYATLAFPCLRVTFAGSLRRPVPSPCPFPLPSLSSIAAPKRTNLSEYRQRRRDGRTRTNPLSITTTITGHHRTTPHRQTCPAVRLIGAT